MSGIRLWLGAGLAGALAACGGDEPVAKADADAGDVLFVPADVTSPATDTAVVADTTAGPTDTTRATDTTAPADTTAPTDTLIVEPDTTTAPDTLIVEPDTTTAPDTLVVEPDTTAPVAGDRCDNAKALGDLDGDDHYDDFGNVGATSGLGDDYAATSCGRADAQTNGAGQRDEVWRFVAATTGEHLVAVLADTSIDVVVYAFAEGACGTTCLGFDDSGAVADIDQVKLTLAAGDVIYVVVDGKASAHAGTYLVDVYDCGGTCPP